MYRSCPCTVTPHSLLLYCITVFIFTGAYMHCMHAYMHVCTVPLLYRCKYRLIETKMIHTTDHCRQPKDYMQKEYHEHEGDRHRAATCMGKPLAPGREETAVLKVSDANRFNPILLPWHCQHCPSVPMHLSLSLSLSLSARMCVTMCSVCATAVQNIHQQRGHRTVILSS